MGKSISVIIPNFNKRDTIGPCLEAAFASEYDDFEIVVVDDGSTDGSVGEIGRFLNLFSDRFPRFSCRLVQLDRHSGTSAARNAGAAAAGGEILFFTDADCLLQQDTLKRLDEAASRYEGKRVVIGGTYTLTPGDESFFSTFQSILINHFETKRKEPDYIAGHAMAIDASLFRESGGFNAGFTPILEDVEFSHRLRSMGFRLVMHPEILVRHIFNFSLAGSLRNAARKSRHWTVYSLMNRDLLADSGVASRELKVNGGAFGLSAVLLSLGLILQTPLLSAPVPLATVVTVVTVLNLLVNRALISAFFTTGGAAFGTLATLYYAALYPSAVWAGVMAGTVTYLRHGGRLGKKREACTLR